MLSCNPVNGDKCWVFHDFPITLGAFLKMAYQKGILSDSAGFGFLTSRLDTQSAEAKDSFMPPLDLPQDGGLGGGRGSDMPIIEIQEGPFVDVEASTEGKPGETPTEEVLETESVVG